MAPTEAPDAAAQRAANAARASAPVAAEVVVVAWLAASPMLQRRSPQPAPEEQSPGPSAQTPLVCPAAVATPSHRPQPARLAEKARGAAGAVPAAAASRARATRARMKMVRGGGAKDVFVNVLSCVKTFLCQQPTTPIL